MISTKEEVHMGRNNNFWLVADEYTPFAVLLPALALLGYIVGSLLDHLFKTDFLRVVVLLLGIVIGFGELLRQIQKDPGSHKGE